MTTRFADHLLDGTHAARPAADTVPTGTLYACRDHGLIYQSDGAAWTTWATLGSGIDSLFLPPSQLLATSGTPTLSSLGVASNRLPAWQMDASANEQIAGNYVVPSGWTTAHFDVYWTNLGAGTGDVIFQLAYATDVDGGNLIGEQNTVVAPAATAPTKDVLKVTRLAADQVITAAAFGYLRLFRVANNAADTLANDIGVLGIRLIKAS